jgi:oxygen-independent coproporphyrinogen III oxidase
MNGIYIHIPFCKKACYYCNFHFTASLKQKDAVVEAIIKEIELRRHYFEGYPETLGRPEENIENGFSPLPVNQNTPSVLHTIYLGGGTPTLLTASEIGRILEKINDCFSIASDAEITVEANPDDLKPAYLSQLHALKINRLSIGVQSFFDDDLKWMNRRHNGGEAERAIKLSQDAGFSNMNIDLIYGLPQLTEERWAENLDKFFTLQIPHLSAYHLTIEPKTVFGYYKSKGRLKEIDEEQSVRHYEMLTEKMKENNYTHYEISNFCKEGQYSRHNTNYWKYGHYLGIGPSAHSYNGSSRQWNSSIDSAYIQALEKGTYLYEAEQLTENERFNDYLLTGLRTIWGIDAEVIAKGFAPKYSEHLKKELSRYPNAKFVEQKSEKIRLTEEGMFVSDKIISELFYVEDR